MAKPNINEVVSWAIKKQTFDKAELMSEFGINRFVAHNLMNELEKIGVIDNYSALPFQKNILFVVATMKQDELDYLGIDVSKVDFGSTNLSDIVNEAMESKLPQKMSLGRIGDYGPHLMATDGNEIRMKCGDLKTGDTIMVSRSESYGHPVFVGATREDFWGYTFKYNHRMEMVETDKGPEYQWVQDDSMNGWGVGQTGINSHIQGKTSFRFNEQDVGMAFSFSGVLLGQPVVNADFLFAQTKGTPIVSLPDTIKSAMGLCYNSGTYCTVSLPNSVENTEIAYANCPFLERVSDSFSEINPVMCTDMFFNCPSLPPEELDKLSSRIDKSVAIRECGTRFVSDKGVLSDNYSNKNIENDAIQNDNREIITKNEDDISH